MSGSHDPLDLHHQLSGETDEDFECCCSFSKKRNWTGWAHSHSPVEGAAANELPGPFPTMFAGAAHTVDGVSGRHQHAAPFIGREMTVLVDEVDDEGRWRDLPPTRRTSMGWS